MNEIQGFENNDIMGKYQKTENILNDIQNIIDVSQKEAYPEIFQTVSGKSSVRLSWSHYAILSKIFDTKARNWYEQEAVRESLI
jgi:hypothetical protein